MGCVGKTVTSDTSLSLGSLLTDGTVVDMIHIEAVLLCAIVTEKKVAVSAKPHSGSAFLPVLRTVVAAVDLVTPTCGEMTLAKTLGCSCDASPSWPLSAVVAANQFLCQFCPEVFTFRMFKDENSLHSMNAFVVAMSKRNQKMYL